ncbi:MAG: hypothetical protein JW741_00900 [Sedimentisphaerales bacterium]|nr:hypothetical protein [Sedimentisphaerales bacterium]
MNAGYRCACVILALACMAVSGCKEKDTTSDSDPGQATVSQAEIDAVRDAVTRNMRKITFGDLRTAPVGTKCVVTARTMEDRAQLGPPPPPPGMVRLLGQTTIYRGELDGVAPDGLTIRAAYPTAGNYKKLKIAKEDIQSIHLPQ